MTDLIDLDDRDHLPPADLLILDKYSHTQNSGGQASRCRDSFPSGELTVSGTRSW